MKNKLAALAAALLLCLSLLPSRAIAVFDSTENSPPAVSEQEEMETPDIPSDPDKPEGPVPQSNIPEHPGDPDESDGEH